MVQPLAYMTPDASVQGFIDLPEFPFALEPRICTRFEMAKYAREAYEAGKILKLLQAPEYLLL